MGPKYNKIIIRRTLDFNHTHLRIGIIPKVHWPYRDVEPACRPIDPHTHTHALHAQMHHDACVGRKDNERMKPCKRWTTRRDTIVEDIKRQADNKTTQGITQTHEREGKSQDKETTTHHEENTENGIAEVQDCDGMADKIKMMRDMFSKEIGEFVTKARNDGYFPDRKVRDDSGNVAHTPIGQKIAKRIVEEVMVDTDKTTRDMFRTIIQMPTDEGAWMINNMAMIAKISTRKAITNLWLCDTGCGHDLIGI